MAKYTVTKRIQHNGQWYDPGDELDEDERSSEALIDAGAIELVETEPAKAEAKSR